MDKREIRRTARRAFNWGPVRKAVEGFLDREDPFPESIVIETGGPECFIASLVSLGVHHLGYSDEEIEELLTKLDRDDAFKY